MNKHDHAVTWFEIPVGDLAGARRFYEAVLAQPLRAQALGGEQLAVFPYESGAVGGCLIAAGAHNRLAPSRQGTVVYLSLRAGMDAALDRASKAGGSVDLPRTALPPGMGCYARIIDPEGNRVGLHALE